MSLETLKREAAALDDSARKELFSFLIELREKQWAENSHAMFAAAQPVPSSNGSPAATLAELAAAAEPMGKLTNEEIDKAVYGG